MVPDHRVKLTAEGHRQAREAGNRLRTLLRSDDTIHFFTSPYRRTRETTEGIVEALSSDSPSPSPFPRHTIKVYEEPRLREQDFGNFQPCSAEMERMWLERADYGHFFYRIPNGESAADAYDRVSGFNESLWRLFGEDDFANVCVLVTHGLMTRVFLMKWYHWSVEYFEDLRNINHCEFVIMKLKENGKYALDNQLRTWSELKKEKTEETNRERTSKGLNPISPSDLTIPIRRRWGGCPDGCNHGLRRTGSKRSGRTYQTDSQRRETDTAKKTNETNAQDSITANADPPQLTASEPGLGDKTPSATPTVSSPDQQTTASQGPQSYISLDTPAQTSTQSSPTLQQSNGPSPSPSPSRTPPPTVINPTSKRPNIKHLHRDSEDHLLHPPRSKLAFLRLTGRDGGGSQSGTNSAVGSEDERERERDGPLRTKSSSRLREIKSSQDIEHDGDDEASTAGRSQKLRRGRSQKLRFNHHLSLRKFTGKNHESSPGDRGSRNGNGNGAVSNQRPLRDKENQDDGGDSDCDSDDIEARRRYDQSIRGSVY